MSYFAGGGWRNPTSTLAQATTTTNNVSASRQGSVDESVPGGSAERKPLLRAQTDPYARGLQRNPSQTSLASNTSNADAAAAAAAGRRFTFRGVARALPFFLRPAAAAVSVVAEEAERAAISTSPPSQSVLDSQIHAPVKRSTLSQEASTSVDEGTRDSTSPIPEEQSESVESKERHGSRGRRSRGSSNGSTIVTEESQAVSQGAEDELSEAKRKLNDFAEQYSTTQRRVRELESENEEKATQMKLAQEAALKEKSELVGVHAAEMEEQRREIAHLQQSLQASQRQAKERGEKVDELAQEKDVLKREVAKRGILVQDAGGQVNDLTAAKKELSGSVQKLQAIIGERDAVVKDLWGRNTALEHTTQLLKKEKAEVEAEIVRKNVSAQAALDQLTKTHHEKMTDVAGKIQRLQEELSESNTTISQLRMSLDSSQNKVNEVSRTAEERAGEALRLQQQLSGAQEKSQALESKVADQISQIRSMKATSEKERADLSTTHAAEMSTQRRMVQNLQTSLESMQHDLQARGDKIVTLTRESQDMQAHVKKLEDQCKAGEARAKGLESELAKAKAAVQDLGKESKALQDKAQKEKAAFTKQVDQLRKELSDAQKVSVERASRIERLEATKSDLENALRRVQASVTEKESTIQGLQQRCSGLEEAKGGLDELVVELEQALIETRDAAEHVLEEVVEGHQRELGRAKSRIQELQDELSSFITTAQQLQASLEASHVETKKAEKVSKERGEEISQLQQRTASLQETVRALETKIAEATSQMKAQEKTTREEKAAILRGHASEMEARRKEAKTRQETLERGLKDKEDKLRALVGEAGTLRQEVATMKERSRKNEQDIETANATLRDVAEQNKSTIERLENEKAKLDDDKSRLDGELARSQHRVEELQQELKERNEEIEKLKENPFHKMGSAVSNALDGLRYLLGVSGSTASRSG